MSLPSSRNSTSRVLTRLCSRKCEYWSRLSWSIPPPAWRLDGDAHRYAGAAVVAVGPVGEDAAAAKAEPHQVRVQLGADQVARGGDLRARHPAGQIAARIGRRHVELQYRMRQIVQLRHGSCAKDAPDQLPGERGE